MLEGAIYSQRKGNTFFPMPSSNDALHQHLLSASYQSWHVWGKMLNKDAGPMSVTVLFSFKMAVRDT